MDETIRDSNAASLRRDSGELEVDGRPISWVRDAAPRPSHALVLLAHGAGAPYTTPFMEAVAVGLAARGSTVVRFHFPYMERRVREGGRRPPDRPPVLLATARRMLELAQERFAEASKITQPLFVSGKSMGGRIFSLLLAEEPGAPVLGAIYLGYPLQPAGQPAKLRAEHLARIAVPQLFVSGSRDPLCDLTLLRPVLLPLGDRARLHVVEGGDHSLATSRRAPLAGSDAWLDVVGSFITENSAPRE